MKKTLFSLLLVGLLLLSACSPTTDNAASTGGKESANSSGANGNAEAKPITGKLVLDIVEGYIGDQVKLSAEKLTPNMDLKVVWSDMVGSYALENNYSFIGTTYEPDDKELLTGTADGDGKWSGTITIPDGFGDDHDVMIYQDGDIVAKANFFVRTVFTMSPESGPLGSEITITGKGLSWKMYGSLWHLNYDNRYTGMITAVSTKGTAKAIIRAAGDIGPHAITIEGGSSGMPYMNREQSAVNYISTHKFTFTVTDDTPATELNYVETPPAPANGGIVVAPPKNKEGVTIQIDKDMGYVGDAAVLTGAGLPPNTPITFDWHTMVGTRVTTQGFGEQIFALGEATTDAKGEFRYEFKVPDDLGGLPHLIDVKVQDDIVGQTYLRILPKIVSITPPSGPVGTEFVVEIKGSGWTEYDNALGATYDNGFLGYICGFNSQGTIKLPLVATGNVGFHVLDIYPTIYKGQQIQPYLYLNPQLTYRDDHPGTGIPAMRAFFEVTEGN